MYYEDLLKDDKEASVLYKDIMDLLRSSYVGSVGSELKLIEEYLTLGSASGTTLGTLRSPYRNEDPSSIIFNSPFGVRLYGGNLFHRGIDLNNISSDKAVVSVADGTVFYAGVLPGKGQDSSLIGISHPNLPCIGAPGFSIYMHCVNINVKVGESVRMGDVVGTEGGAYGYPVHLHFELRDANYQCIDPADVLNLTPAQKQKNIEMKKHHEGVAAKLGKLQQALNMKNTSSIYGISPKVPVSASFIGPPEAPKT